MTDQETGGAPAPVTDAPASQVEQPTEVTSAKPGSEADSSPAATESDKPKSVKTGEQLRIDELTRRLRESERRYERVLKIAEERGTPPPPPPQAPPTQTQAKTLKDFGYDERAYTDHLYSEARKVAEESAKEAGARFRAEQEAITRRAKFDERVTQFKATVEDYDEVVTPSTPVSEGMADALLDSDEAGALMYYLGQNPDVASKLYHLSPAKAGREIQKIEDRLVAERKKAAQKPVSQAPPPAPKIEGEEPKATGFKPDDPESDTLSDDEWVRRRNKQIQARRK